MFGNKTSQFKESIIFLKKVLYSKESVILNDDFYFLPLWHAKKVSYFKESIVLNEDSIILRYHTS